jgi:hypothetical protein
MTEPENAPDTGPIRYPATARQVELIVAANAAVEAALREYHLVSSAVLASFSDRTGRIVGMEPHELGTSLVVVFE